MEFGKGDIVRNFIFEEEYVTIPSIDIDNEQNQGQISSSWFGLQNDNWRLLGVKLDVVRNQK